MRGMKIYIPTHVASHDREDFFSWLSFIRVSLSVRGWEVGQGPVLRISCEDYVTCFVVLVSI